MLAVDIRATGGQMDFVNERKLFDGEMARESTAGMPSCSSKRKTPPAIW